LSAIDQLIEEFLRTSTEISAPAEAVRALISNRESAPYAEHLRGYHICDGLFEEWFHWNKYAFDGLADYSPGAQRDFRAWLRRRHSDDAGLLSSGWQREAYCGAVEITAPRDCLRPAHMEFYDPVRDRPAIDRLQCFSETVFDSIAYPCREVKEALPEPRVVGVFYGYPSTNMPRPQLNGQYALGKPLQCPYADFLASPHIYDSWGQDGYHSPQCVSDSV
jgi:beta-galactosidase